MAAITRTMQRRLAIAVFSGAWLPIAWPQSWQPAGTLPGFTARPHCFGLTWRQYYFSPDQVLCLGGTPFDANNDSTVQGLTSGVGTWGSRASIDNGPLLGRGGGIDASNRIVIFGGYDPDGGDTGGTDAYDPTQGLTMGLADRPGSAAAWNFAFCSDDNSRVYSIGGGDGEGASAANPNSQYCARYLSASDSWEAISAMNSAVADACAAFDGQGRILVFGGVDRAATARTANVASYEIASDSWSDSDIPDLPVAVSGASAVLGADGRIYLIGGVSGPVGAGVPQSTTYILDLTTSSWSNGPNLATPRFHFAATGLRVANGLVIYAMGGDNGNGGTASVESLATYDCPEILAPPTGLTAYAGQTAGFSVVARGGGTLIYQWRHNGIALNDGPSGTGSTIAGSHTSGLGILRPAAADVGSYECVITNPCGVITTAPAALAVVPSPVIPVSGWTFVDLSAAGAVSQRVNSVSGDAAAGWVNIHWDNDTYGQKAARWDADGGTITYLHDGTIPAPQNSPDYANAIAGDVVVGRHYQFVINSEYPLGAYYPRGAVWVGNSPNPTILEFGAEPYRTDGTHHAGAIYVEDRPGDETWYPHASVWPTPTGSGTTLGWSGEISSVAYGLDWPHQFGGSAGASDGTSEFVHAVMWTGSSTTNRTMHPLTAYPGGTSYILGAAQGQQVGYAGTGYTNRHGGLWSNSRASWIEYTPTLSQLDACSRGYQLAADRLFAGPDSVPLQLFGLIPAGYSSFQATCLDIDTLGVIRIGGTAMAGSAPHAALLVWYPPASCPGDLNGDNAVDLADLTALLAHFGTTSGGTQADGDLDADGDVDLADLASLLAQFGSNC